LSPACVASTTRVWTVDALGRRHVDALEARALARRLADEGAFRKYTWREGTAESLHARFAFVRVVPAADDGREPRKRERLWLVCEWRDDDDAPCHFHLVTYERMPFVQMVHLVKERWRTERVYQDMKEELGLDHFEGRRFRGWHHDVSVAIVCYAFLVAERPRRFPPLESRSAERRCDSESRPERHFRDLLITIRLAFARATRRWLPRCPACLSTWTDAQHGHAQQRPAKSTIRR
jgi:hypothetical protein